MDPTNDPALRSFIDVPADSHFPIQNLPYGVFRHGGSPPAIGVGIGEFVLDLTLLETQGLLPTTGLFNRPVLNPFIAEGRTTWAAVRETLSSLLRAGTPTLRDNAALRDRVVVPMADVEMLLPCEIGDYTDFYSSREHATNVGTMLRGA